MVGLQNIKQSVTSERSKVGNVNNTEYSLCGQTSCSVTHGVWQLGLTPQLEHVQKSTTFMFPANCVYRSALARPSQMCRNPRTNTNCYWPNQVTMLLFYL